MYECRMPGQLEIIQRFGRPARDGKCMCRVNATRENTASGGQLRELHMYRETVLMLSVNRGRDEPVLSDRHRLIDDA